MSKYKMVAWWFIVGAVWAFITTMAIYGWDVFSMGSSEWKSVVIAILTQCGTVATLWLAPWFKQFGIGKGE